MRRERKYEEGRERERGSGGTERGFSQRKRQKSNKTKVPEGVEVVKVRDGGKGKREQTGRGKEDK